jgi:hypothetical protein
MISIDFFHDFKAPDNYQITEIGEMEFKGRKEKSKVFSVEFN